MRLLPSTASQGRIAFVLGRTGSMLGLLGFLFILYVAAVNNGMVYLLVFAAGIGFVYWFLKDVRVRFAATVAMIFLVQVNQENQLYLYAASAVYAGGLLVVFVKNKLMEGRTLSNTRLDVAFMLFLFWGTVIGLLNVVAGQTRIEWWVTELLVWAPMLLLPIYYAEIIRENIFSERFLVRCLLVLWAAVFLAEVVKFRQNIGNAVYLFQIGFERLDSVNGAFMMFAFLSIAMLTAGKKRMMFVAGFLISFGSLLLSLARTSWVASVLVLPLLFLASTRDERKSGYRFLVMVVVVLAIALVIGYLYVPAVRLGILFITSKFASAMNMKTDLSMQGRYFEWERVMDAVAQMPITGHGFGGRYANFNWFAGYTYITGYTHSGYLGLLFKTGIVGLILMAIPFIGYLGFGLKRLRHQMLTLAERAYMRTGVALIIFVAILGYTGNIFIQREMSLYIALYWCYCVQIDMRLRERQRQTAEART